MDSYTAVIKEKFTNNDWIKKNVHQTVYVVAAEFK